MISVIMSVYNEKEQWLREAIESILNQTVTNFEFIIILDNPNNKVLDNVIKSYSTKDDRIRYFINEKNIGLTASLNFALSKTRGKYIARMDADDISELDRLEKQYNFMKSHYVDILGSNIVEFYDNYEHKSNFFCKDYEIRTHILESNMLAHPTWFCKKEVYENLNGYRNMFACEDYDFILRALQYGYTVENMTDYLLRYRLNPNSISRTGLLKQKLASNYLARHFFEINEITPEELLKNLNTVNKKKESKYTKAYKMMCDYHKTSSIVKKIMLLFYSLIVSPYYFWINHFSVNTKSQDSQLKTRIKFFIKIKLFSVIRKYHCFNKNQKNKRIILIDVPQYRNLGDHAIAYAEKQFFQNNFSDYDICEISIDRFERVYWDLYHNINPNDIIVLIGGGNFGVEYFILELHRRQIIRHLKNKIFLFPQTIYFGFSKFGMKQFQNTIKIYSKNKNLVMMAREKYSYHIMKENFLNDVYLVPDIVLYLNVENNLDRKKVMLCLRDDLEGKITEEQSKFIYNDLNSKLEDIISFDTVVNECVTIENRKKNLKKCFNLFNQSKFVITDRLHGMIFCYVTNTPCIIFGNYNYKVRGVYETWLKDCKNFIFCNSIDDYNSIKKLDCFRKNDSKKIKYNFNELKKIIDEYIAK